jgi:hypothetical protein
MVKIYIHMIMFTLTLQTRMKGLQTHLKAALTFKIRDHIQHQLM